MTPTLTDEQIRALMEAATPGPWFMHDFTAPEVNSDPTALDVTVSCTWPDHICVASMGGGYEGYQGLVQARKDARLIAAAPDLAAGYLARGERIAELDGRLEALEMAIMMAADQALVSEIPEGYGPEPSPDFDRGYDAAIQNARKALEAGK